VKQAETWIELNDRIARVPLMFSSQTILRAPWGRWRRWLRFR
jgi:hypothetical protein